ncbi:MAG: DNA methyltransferase [Candidatus Thorarchaeota archaeon]
MTEYAFVLGKNWTLSIAELLEYLTDRGIDYDIVDYSRTSIVLDLHRYFEPRDLGDIQEALGGCYKIGKVVSRFNKDLAVRAFPAKGNIHRDARGRLRECPWVDRIWDRVRGKKIKFGFSTYPLVNYESKIDLKKLTLGLDEWTKRKLTESGARRAIYYAYDESNPDDPDAPNMALWPQTVAEQELYKPPNSEILVLLTTNRMYIANTIVLYDSMLQKYRDESRPYVAAEISTSPKICRTLLNLAGARRGDTVLDPFCGTGTLLMEAALLGMHVIGIDLDGNTAQGARSNLQWLERDLDEKIEYRIIRGDARKADRLIQETIDAVAFEPELGPVFDNPPQPKKAKSIISDLTKLYTQTLNAVAMRLRPSGRVGMTLPVINAVGNQVNVDVYKMTEGTPFSVKKMLRRSQLGSQEKIDERVKLYPNRETLPERKRGQVVQRDVLMLSKD